MVSRRLQINLKTNPATSAGSLFLSWLRGLVVIESLDPLEDVRLPPAPGAFRDVKRLREVTIRRVRLFQTVLTPMPSMAATSVSDSNSCIGGGSTVSAFLRSLICVFPYCRIRSSRH